MSLKTLLLIQSLITMKIREVKNTEDGADAFCQGQLSILSFVSELLAILIKNEKGE